MRSLLVYLLALAAIAAGVTLGFPYLFAAAAEDVDTEQAESVAPPVVVAPVVRQPFVDRLEALGTVFANESVEITVNRADHVAALHFDDGQKVKKGQLLAEMNVLEEAARLTEAVAVRDEFLLNEKRQKDLFDRELASARAYEAAQAKLAAAEARVKSLQAAIDDRRIEAPFAGILGLRRVSVGAFLQPSTIITTLDDLSVVKLDFTIPEPWLAHVREGMEILARGDAWPGQEFKGHVTTIATRLDARTRSVIVRAKLPNPETRLRPGMLLKITINRGEAPVLQIPEEALIPIGDDNFVLRVDAEKIAERVAVKVGRRRVGRVEIVEGLKLGDSIVIEGIVRVRPGHAVIVVKTVVPGS